MFTGKRVDGYRQFVSVDGKFRAAYGFWCPGLWSPARALFYRLRLYLGLLRDCPRPRSSAPPVILLVYLGTRWVLAAMSGAPLRHDAPSAIKFLFRKFLRVNEIVPGTFRVLDQLVELCL